MILDFLRRPGAVSWLQMFLLCRIGCALIGRLVEPWLVDRRLSLGFIAVVRPIIGDGASILGAVAGYHLTRSLRHRHVLSTLLLVRLVSAALFASIARPPTMIILALILLNSIAVAGLTVAMLAAFSEVSRPPAAGTEAALQSATDKLSTLLAGTLAGAIAERFGYRTTFVAAALVSGLTAVVIHLRFDPLFASLTPHRRTSSGSPVEP